MVPTLFTARRPETATPELLASPRWNSQGNGRPLTESPGNRCIRGWRLAEVQRDAPDGSPCLRSRIGWRSAGEDPGLQEPAGDEEADEFPARIKTHGGDRARRTRGRRDGRAPGSPPTGPDKPSRRFAAGRGARTRRAKNGSTIDPEPACARPPPSPAASVAATSSTARQQRLHLLIEECDPRFG